MNSDSNGPSPKRLKTLAFHVKFSRGNNLLHQFVLDNSDPNHSGSRNYLNAMLLSMCCTESVNELNEDGYCALHLAVLKKNLLMVEMLSCLVSIDLNTRCGVDKMNCTSLHLAVKLGHLSIAQELISKSAVIDIEDMEGYTPLYYAVISSDIDAMKLLIRNGANLNRENVGGIARDLYPIFEAVLIGNLEVIKFLILNGADINVIARDSEETTLHFAVQRSNLAVVELLVDKIADVNYRDEYGITPLSTAVTLGNIEIIKCLIRYGADIDAKYIINALKSNKLAVAEFLLRNGFKVTADNRFRLLSAAASSGHLIFLLDRGVQLDIEGEYGRQLLRNAILSGNLESITYLLDKGVIVNPRDTILFWAYRHKKYEILKLLKER